MDIIVGIVVYRNALNYLEECLESLKKQTYKDFILMLINDDLPIGELQNITDKLQENYCNQVIIIDKCGENLEPYMLRIKMIREAYQRQADLLVMLDCDDKASENRIECIYKQFDTEYSFFYNSLLDFEGKSVMPSLPEYTISYKDIGEYNYLGMSNGTINLKKLSFEFIESLEDGKTNIFDWYLYSRILLEGGIGKKIQGCYTYYRIYERNIAGKSIYGKKAIERELSIKLQHYRLLDEKDIFFKDLLKIYSEIKVEDVIPKTENGYWWSLIDHHSLKNG